MVKKGICKKIPPFSCNTRYFHKYIIHFTGPNLFMDCPLTCQFIRKGATTEVYVSIRNRNPPLCKYVKQKTKVNIGPNNEARENKIMMKNIVMKISFPSIFMMNPYSYET